MSGCLDQESGSERYHSLDALRGFALLLGLFFHGAQSFVVNNPFWAIVDSHPSALLPILSHVSHCFRMEVFFLLAGFFARLLVRRRGGIAFCRNRFGRIFIPFVVGWVLLHPLMVALWIVAGLESGRTQIPLEARHLPVWQLTVGFFREGHFWRGLNMGHLWFLHQLLVLYLLSALGYWLWRVVDRGKVLARLLDRLLVPMVRGRMRLVTPMLPTLALLLLMRSWQVDVPAFSLIPELGPTLLYGLCFGLGWFLHRRREVLPDLGRGWPTYLLVGAAAITVTLLFQDLGRWLGLEGMPPAAARVLYAGFYALAMWGFVWGFLGLFVRCVAAESRAWRYVADGSYWVYLVHMPLVLALQIWVARWDLAWPIKFGFIMLLALVLLYLSYHYLVRSTFIGRQLNGRTVPFRSLPPWIGAK